MGDKYKGKFDDGWDAYRERVFKRAKEKGWIPGGAKLTPRHESMPSWDSIPDDEKPFQRRLMELGAGFSEHVDVQVGRIVDELSRLGYGNNTLIFYIWGDNGSSSEGQGGTISELLAQNGIPTTVNSIYKHLRNLVASTRLAHPRPIRNTMPDGRGPAVPRIRARSYWPHISAVLVTRWPYAGRRRSSPTRRHESNSTT